MEVLVTDNPAERRFEARVGTTLAGFAAYSQAAGQLVFTHTEVDGAFEGQGVGSTLARYGLDEARRRQLSVLPACSFIRGWIDRHLDYADLLADPHSSSGTDA